MAKTAKAGKVHLSEAQITDVLETTADTYPRAWQHCHQEGDPERYDFIILAGRKLYPMSGGTVGCNWKRAVVGDLSMDGLTVESPSNGRYYFDDVITGAGSSSASISYQHPYFDEANLLRDASGKYAPQGFANPMELKTEHDYGLAGGWGSGGIPVPEPPEPEPAKVRPYPGDAKIQALYDLYMRDKTEAGEVWDRDSLVWVYRPSDTYYHDSVSTSDQAAWDEGVKVHRWGWPEEQGKGGWRAAMGLPPDPNRPL